MNHKENLINIISTKMRVDKSTINLNTNILTDLGADSLDLIELVMSIEETFKIQIEEEEYENRVTVDKILELVEHKLSNNKVS